MFVHVRSVSASADGVTRLRLSAEVVLRKLTPYAAHQAPDGQVESWRAVLTFVVAVWREIQHLVTNPLMTKDMFDNSVDFRVTLPASLVVKAAGIANAGEDQSVSNARCA